jgi:hypothetical protein
MEPERHNRVAPVGNMKKDFYGGATCSATMMPMSM